MNSAKFLLSASGTALNVLRVNGPDSFLGGKRIGMLTLASKGITFALTTKTYGGDVMGKDIFRVASG